MKRRTRKSGRKVPTLWDESMDFEVPVTPLADSTDEPDVASNIILLPLPNLPQKLPQNPPPIAA